MAVSGSSSESFGKPVSIKNTFGDMSYIDKVNIKLNEILSKKGLYHIHPSLSFALSELIGNANKANLKRVYFRLNGLELNIPEDYQKGVSEFTSLMLENSYSIETYLNDYKMYVETIFHEYADNKFTVYVVNNSTLLDEERERIIQKIKYFQVIKENTEAVMDLIDNTEAAGMGIFLTLKLLDQVGISPKRFAIGVHNLLTIAKISFEYSTIIPSPITLIAKEILSQLTGLPQYPPNVKALIIKLMDPHITPGEVSSDLQKDPSLTTELLKLVNSAQFSLNRKISSIKEALNFVGIKGLKNILYTFGAITSMNSKFGNVEEVWDHSNKTAKYASKIARLKKTDKKEDDFFTAGLLHDIGKIVLMNFDKKMEKKIETFCTDKGLETNLIEDMIMGVSHATIGGIIAKHWEFPENLISAIMYHHDPYLATDNNDVVNAVHLANEFARIKPGSELNLYAIDPSVRNYYNITDQKKLNLIFEDIIK